MINWRSTSIRTRLLLAYMSILVVGFVALTLVAGRQISAAARADYEGQLVSAASLITRGVRPFVTEDDTTGNISEELAEVIASYEAEAGLEVEFMRLGRSSFEFNIERAIIEQFRQPDGVTNRSVIRQRDEQGELRLYTVTIILEDPFVSADGSVDDALPLDDMDVDDIALRIRDVGPAILIVSVPYDQLETLILQRWLVLLGILLLVGTLALLATHWVARTIVRPLYHLRDTAVLLAQGDFSHRIKELTQDEIGEVGQAFNEMAQQVESMLEEQRAFASNTSHELRTPLTTIRLRSEALRYEALDDETRRTYIVQIDDEALRLSALIEDLTLLSRFDANRAELGQSEIDLVRLAEHLLQRSQKLAQEKRLTLQLHSADTVPPIVASLNHVTILFRNVLDNALKYTPSGGRIDWHIAAQADGVLSVIQDTGHGIEPQHLPHLFERFYRADQSHSRDVPGTGLGLPLVQSILQAYGGSVTVESGGRGKGTLVRLWFPYCMTDNP